MDRDVLKAAITERYHDIEISVAPIDYILLGIIWYLGDISRISEDELLEYNDVQDFLNVYI